MNLLIDAGNTFTKAAICRDGEIISILKPESDDALRKLGEEYRPEFVMVASVTRPGQEMAAFFTGAKKALVLNHTTPLPFENLYETPATLGMDRLAGVAGALALYPGSACLCVDAGTCIKYDLIDEKARYQGGSISPGIDMRFKALHTFTSRLPLIERREQLVLTGKSTETSILSGVMTGAVREAEGIIQEYRQLYPGLKILFTGGDARFFESNIKESIFVVPELLFLGLNRILQHNVS